MSETSKDNTGLTEEHKEDILRLLNHGQIGAVESAARIATRFSQNQQKK